MKKQIAVYMSQLFGEVEKRICQGLEEQAAREGIGLTYFPSMSDNTIDIHVGTAGENYNNGERVIFRLPDLNRYDGVIAMIDNYANVHWDEVREMLRSRAGCPVVSIRSREPGMINILSDDDISFKNMVNHIIHDHGCRRINMVTGPKISEHSFIRRDIYIDALEEAGIPYEEGRLYYGNFWKNCGDDAVTAFLNSGLSMPEAVICANDYMAISVTQALIDRGYRVPEDVLVTGYDDVEEARYNFPAISTVTQPFEEMGRRAVSAIASVSRGEEVPENIYVPAHLIYRQSCGCDACREDMGSRFRQILLDREEKYFHYINNVAAMMTTMSNAGNLETCFELLKSFVQCGTGFEDFAICLADGWEDTRPLPEKDFYLTDEQMSVPFCLVDGIMSKPFSFSKKEIVPPVMQETGKFYQVVPLHYLENYQGYAVFSAASEKPQTYLEKSWFLSLESCLESQRMQMKMREINDHLSKMYNRDVLTGLYNRRGMEHFCQEFFIKCYRNHSRMMVMELDMDGLKYINDIYGHDHGDFCLHTLADAMKYAAQSGEICVRSGGDEFIVLGCYYDQETLDIFIEDFQQYLEQINTAAQRPYQVGCSIGYYMAVPDPNQSAEDFIKRADANMYKEKEAHRKASYPGSDYRPVNIV